MSVYRHMKYPELSRLTIKNVTRLNHKLGSGSFGFYEELVIEREQHVAGKTFLGGVLDPHQLGTDKVMRRFESECQMLHRVHHPNIAQFVGVCFFQTYPPLIITELLHGTLDNLINNTSNIPPIVKFQIFNGIARGLVYLHSNTPPLIHKDLTSHNILLNKDISTIKIADLCNSLLVDPDKFNEVVCLDPTIQSYMPPEVLESSQTGYSPAVDIFSFGQLALYTMINRFPGNLPPKVIAKLQVRTEVERRKIYFDTLKDMMAKRVPIIEMIERCLEDSPQNRPHADEILEIIGTQISEGCEIYASIPTVETHYDEAVNSLLKGEPELLEMYTTGSTFKRPGWKSYVFQLQNSLLTYKKSNMKDILGKASISSIANVEVEDCVAFSDKFKFYFKIHFVTGNTVWSLRTFTEQKRNNWISAINSCIKQKTRKVVNEPVYIFSKEDMPMLHTGSPIPKRSSLIFQGKSVRDIKDHRKSVPDHMNIFANPAYHGVEILTEKMTQRSESSPPPSVTSDDSYEFLPEYVETEYTANAAVEDYEDVIGPSSDHVNTKEEEPPPIPPKMRQRLSTVIDPVIHHDSHESEEYISPSPRRDVTIAIEELENSQVDYINEADSSFPNLIHNHEESPCTSLLMTEENSIDSIEMAALQVDCPAHISLGSLSPLEEITSPNVSMEASSQQAWSSTRLYTEEQEQTDTASLKLMEQALQTMQLAYADMPNTEFAAMHTTPDIGGACIDTNFHQQWELSRQDITQPHSKQHSTLMKNCLKELLQKTPTIHTENLLMTDGKLKSMTPELKKLARADSITIEDTKSLELLPLQSQVNVINRSQLLNIRSIGQGHFGSRSRAELLHYGTSIKVLINTVEKTHDKRERERFLKRQKIIAELLHPNVARSFVVLDQEFPMIVTELLPNEDLKAFLLNNRRPINSLLKYMLDVSMGMHYLAQKRIVHRNITARSIIVAQNEKCKISNFTYLMHSSDKNSNIPRNESNKLLRWMAPESIDENRKIFSTASDVWSFGILQWEMRNVDKLPYSDMTIEEVQLSKTSCLAIPRDYPQEIKNIMKACWQQDPSQRPSFLLIANILTNLVL